MKLRGKQVHAVEVDVTPAELLEATIDWIGEKYDMKERWVATHDGKLWVCQDEQGWRHGSVGTEYVREASERDCEAAHTIKALQSMKYAK